MYKLILNDSKRAICTLDIYIYSACVTTKFKCVEYSRAVYTSIAISLGLRATGKCPDGIERGRPTGCFQKCMKDPLMLRAIP